MKLTPWLVLLSLILVSCSGSKSAQSVDQETPQVELSDADEFIENPNEEPNAVEASDVAESSSEPTDPQPVLDEPVISSTEPAEASVVEEPVITDTPAPVVTPQVTDVAQASGVTEKVYTVGKNETLMLIAFKLYGDYERWKELANHNRSQLNGSTSLRNGMKLKYLSPAEEFVWNPQGLPYLIRTGDTLGIISNNVYQDKKKWKLIWNNNRPLIKDPNRIFAGFTIYYLENGREVAAEM